MKNTLILLLALLFTCQLNAQEDKDRSGLVLGGSVTLNNSNRLSISPSFVSPGIAVDNLLNTKNFSLSLSPYVGKQVNDKSLIGVGLYAGHSLDSFTNDSGGMSSFTRKVTNTTLGLSAFYRFYLSPDKKINFFLQPNLGFRTSFGKVEQNAPALDETKGNLYLAAVDIGATYAISEKWHFLVQIAGANYSYSKSRMASQEDSVTDSNFSLNTRLRNISVGLERRF